MKTRNEIFQHLRHFFKPHSEGGDGSNSMTQAQLVEAISVCGGVQPTTSGSTPAPPCVSRPPAACAPDATNAPHHPKMSADDVLARSAPLSRRSAPSASPPARAATPAAAPSRAASIVEPPAAPNGTCGNSAPLALPAADDAVRTSLASARTFVVNAPPRRRVPRCEHGLSRRDAIALRLSVAQHGPRRRPRGCRWRRPHTAATRARGARSMAMTGTPAAV